jgi:hypothetical protein
MANARPVTWNCSVEPAGCGAGGEETSSAEPKLASSMGDVE